MRTATPMYGKVYGMHKTTVYIPEDLKRALTQIAAARQLSEAELIREALLALAARSAPVRPRAPLFESGKTNLAERADEALAGFGEP
jgi:Ribbon-helix-helix protein, copG family